MTPLRQENVKFTVLGGMIAIVIIVTMIVEAFIAVFAKDDAKILLGEVTTFAGLGLGQLFLMFRHEQARQQAANQREAMNQRLDETAIGVQELHEKVTTPIQTQEELSTMVREVVRQVCEEQLKVAAKEQNNTKP